MKPTNLLIMGLGGNVSQGILKALSVSDLDCRIIGACVSPYAAGLFATDRAYISPPAAHPSFPDWLVSICRRERIHGVLSGVEQVLDVLAEHGAGLEAETGAVAVVSRPDALAVCNDKLRTSRWLAANGLDAPRSADAADRGAVDDFIQEHGYPVIAKPRIGKGSHGVTVVSSTDQLEGVLERTTGYVVQEYLRPDDQEYTAATFTDREGRVRGGIAMRRNLQHGTTAVAEVGQFPEVRKYAGDIAAALRPTGPCNVQLRLTDRGPVCFEINLRFSGTSGLRARFGFNDVAAAVRHYVLREPAEDLPEVVSGVALRYWSELYLDPSAVSDLGTNGELSHPRQAVRGYDTFGFSS